MNDIRSLSPDSQANDQRQIKFWEERIKSAAKLPQYVEFRKTKQEAKQFYKGDQISVEERAAWEGDTVQANLFRRTVNFMSETVYAQNPGIRVPPRRKMKTRWPDFENRVASVETHLKYIFEEENFDQLVRTVWKDSYFGNLAVAKIDFDQKRGLWRAKWVAGELICDPDAYGDLSRARWVAEKVELPRYRVWQDKTFDSEARKIIKSRSNQGNISYSENLSGGFGDIDEKSSYNRDVEILWYVYTKEGLDPIFDIDPISNRLLVIAENCDRWLLNVENPTPYLDDDEYPYVILRLDELPGEFIGPAMWKNIDSICKSFNWAASYHMNDMRKTATRPIAYDKERLDDPQLLRSRKHMIPIPVSGDPKTVISPVDLGQADKTIFDSVQFFSDLLDKIMGVENIARGEEGKTKTATESQILQANSNIIMRGSSRALDNFLNDLIRKIGLASLYYTPAFSVIEVSLGQYMTKLPVQMPVVDPISQLPQIDPTTGQPVLQMQLQMVPVQSDGPVKGIDYFHGDEVAMSWPVQLNQNYNFEEIKSDLDFRIEAGSSRIEKRMEKKQTALELFNTVGQIYFQMGLFDQYYEILNRLISAFDIEDIDKLLPPKEKFVQMSMMQMMQVAPPAGGANYPTGKPEKFKESQNPGKTFPLEAGNSPNRSSGGE